MFYAVALSGYQGANIQDDNNYNRGVHQQRPSGRATESTVDLSCVCRHVRVRKMVSMLGNYSGGWLLIMTGHSQPDQAMSYCHQPAARSIFLLILRLTVNTHMRSMGGGRWWQPSVRGYEPENRYRFTISTCTSLRTSVLCTLPLCALGRKYIITQTIFTISEYA